MQHLQESSCWHSIQAMQSKPRHDGFCLGIRVLDPGGREFGSPFLTKRRFGVLGAGEYVIRLELGKLQPYRSQSLSPRL